MTTQRNPAVRKPKNLDLAKAEKVIQRIIRENEKWIKEMADK